MYLGATLLALHYISERPQCLICCLIGQFLSMYQAEYPPELWVTDGSLPQKVHLLEDIHICMSSDFRIE